MASLLLFQLAQALPPAVWSCANVKTYADDAQRHKLQLVCKPSRPLPLGGDKQAAWFLVSNTSSGACGTTTTSARHSL